MHNIFVQVNNNRAGLFNNRQGRKEGNGGCRFELLKKFSIIK